jgi:hypothetical protein
LAGEYAMLCKIRAAVGPRTVLYPEGIPTDVMPQFTDGAYTVVRAAIFNGEGQYLSGEASHFLPACLVLIRKTHALRREHAEAFTSLDPTPLVSTLNSAMHAYRFPARRSVVWTFLHTGAAPLEGSVLRVPHRAGCRYLDAWNGRVLTPVITSDGHAVISLPLDAGGAGGVVQAW